MALFRDVSDCERQNIDVLETDFPRRRIPYNNTAFTVGRNRAEPAGLNLRHQEGRERDISGGGVWETNSARLDLHWGKGEMLAALPEVPSPGCCVPAACHLRTPLLTGTQGPLSTWSFRKP